MPSKIKPLKSKRKKKKAKRSKTRKVPAWSRMTRKQRKEEARVNKAEKSFRKQGFRYHGYSPHTSRKWLKGRRKAYGKGWEFRSIKTKSVSSGKPKRLIYAKKT